MLLTQVAVCSLSKALHGSQLLDSYVETDDQLLQLTVQVNFLLLSRMLTDLPSYTALHHSGLGDDAQLVTLAPEEFMSAKLVSVIQISFFQAGLNALLLT